MKCEDKCKVYFVVAKKIGKRHAKCQILGGKMGGCEGNSATPKGSIRPVVWECTTGHMAVGGQTLACHRSYDWSWVTNTTGQMASLKYV